LSQNQLLLVEVLAAALGTAARVWMLTWLARRIAAEEESVQPTQHFAWERINDRYRRDESALRTAMRGPPPGISRAAWRRGRGRGLFKRTKSRADPANLYRRTVVVVEFGGGGGGLDPTKAAGGSGGMDLDYMSDVITFLLKQHRDQVFAGSSGRNGTGQPELEVVFLVNSPGGSVATYGLAAAQIQRLSGQEGITVTVCVDKYAASGGYMIASQADQLIAAPFASIGSVGVILEGLNFHELAKRYGVQPLVLKAGQSKNPLTTWGYVVTGEDGSLQRLLMLTCLMSPPNTRNFYVDSPTGLCLGRTWNTNTSGWRKSMRHSKNLWFADDLHWRVRTFGRSWTVPCFWEKRR
jgi:hypothetical protein